MHSLAAACRPCHAPAPSLAARGDVRSPRHWKHASPSLCHGPCLPVSAPRNLRFVSPRGTQAGPAPGATPCPRSIKWAVDSDSDPFVSSGRRSRKSASLPQAVDVSVVESAVLAHEEGPGEEVPALVQVEEEAAVESAPFEWKSNWYAVAAADDLDRSRPHALMVLGRRIVLWFDSSRAQAASASGASSETETAWRCFLDQCPHRLVPLSEGRIDEQGRLQCSYHGWAFDGAGSCQHIPQAAKDGPEARATLSPRACAVPFPVTEQLGILFVWPDETPAGAARAAATRPPVPAGVDESYRLRAFSRELSYGYEMLAENVVDPSHLPFAHHGVGPLNRAHAIPYPHASVTSESEGLKGFVGRLLEPRFPHFSPVHFQAPGLFTYHRTLLNSGKVKVLKDGQVDPQALQQVEEVTFEEVEAGRGGLVLLTALYITPVAPGRSRLTTLEGSNRPPSGLLGSLLSKRWVAHLFLQEVLDGDAFFLHAQEKAVQALEDQAHLPQNGAAPAAESSRTGKPASSLISSAYFLPTSADRFVIGFRKWLDRFAGRRVKWPAEFEGAQISPDWAPKAQVLDRYNGHTASCTTCSTALKRFEQAQKALFATAAALLLLAFNLRVGLWARIGLLAVSGGAAAIGASLQKFIDRFIYTGYDHATR